jgi:hypothetical protein
MSQEDSIMNSIGNGPTVGQGVRGFNPFWIPAAIVVVGAITKMLGWW